MAHLQHQQHSSTARQTEGAEARLLSCVAMPPSPSIHNPRTFENKCLTYGRTGIRNEGTEDESDMSVNGTAVGAELCHS